MSNVWVCVPSARPVAEVREWAAKWQAMGYKVALWRDGLEYDLRHIEHITSGKYPGYAQATNSLIDSTLTRHADCDWCVAGGDDVYPDPNKRADEIAAECSEHFAMLNERFGPCPEMYARKATFGVMQPTGDRWGDDATSRARWPDAPAMIDRICGSPWIGREFSRRVNGGWGPFWPEYFHNWCDEELQNVALKLGVFWQRQDLTHFHDHARRNGGQWKTHQQGFDADYVRMKPLFDRRKAAGFPGHEVIA